MTKPVTDRPIRRKAGSPPHSAAWAVLGALGLGYLGVAFFAPQLLPDLSGGRQHISETAVLKTAADVEGIKSSLTKLELDLASVRSDVNSQASQTQSLSAQVTALDDKVRLMQAPGGQPADTQPQAQAQPPQPDTQQTAEVPAFGVGAEQAQDADGGPAPTRVINAPPRVGAPIETGSVDTAKKPITFGPAVVKPAAKAVGIQLATDATVDGLRVTWGALSQIHADKLGHLKARYADLGTAASPSFGLIAGPLKSKAEAKKLCKDLTAQSISCKVSEYKGEAL